MENPKFVNKIEIIERTRVTQFLHAIKKAVTVPSLDNTRMDVSICCLILGEGGVVMKTISFSTPPFMQIDDSIFERDEVLFRFVVDNYLPKGYLNPLNDSSRIGQQYGK
jgi:hypothetical protein